MNLARGCFTLLILATVRHSYGSEDDRGSQLLAEAARAAREGKLAVATALATDAIRHAPDNQRAYRLRAALHSTSGEHSAAIADYDQLLRLAPKVAELYDQRGSEHFMAGHIDDSIQDFDRYLELRPQQEPSHWKRGISYYYAGRYDDGRRQFEGYQTVDDNDVENAVWRYLCMARAQDVPSARDAILKIKRDSRVPMMEVYALYSGRAQPQEVLAAARAGSPAPEVLNTQLFYAHLYLGLYYEAGGDARLANEHISAAVDHRIGHYMWNVAQVHAQLLKQKSHAP